MPEQDTSRRTRVAILTVSTLGSQGKREDTSGAAIRELVQTLNVEIVDYRILPDDRERIATHLRYLTDELHADLVLTTGGTGLSPTDWTPEATLDVVERRVPGFEEIMRVEGFKKTPYAVLSRGVCGIRKNTLIVNLPGNPKGVRESLELLVPVLPHGLKVLRGDPAGSAEHRG